MPYTVRKHLCGGTYIKDLERRARAWIIWVGPKCNHVFPFKREAEGDLPKGEAK